ncbi:MAG: GDSL-type esterase/lipase family protein [Oscillospiraceae bacterium]
MDKKIVRKHKKITRMPLLVLALLILIIIGILVFMYIFFVRDDMKNPNYETGQYKDEGFVEISSNQPSSDETLEKSSTENSSQQEESQPTTSSADDTSSPDDTSSKEDVPVENPTIVPKSEAVEKAYFDDAVFIGDSISKGLKIYGVLPPKNVVADQNVGIDQIANDKAVYVANDGTKTTLFNALKQVPITPKKVYIMLGSNGLPHYENNQHIEYYYKVIDRIMQTYPDAKIYLQSVTPITAAAEETYRKNGKTFTNKKINEFNELVLNMAKEKGLYYINVKDSLVDANGYLSSEYAGADGVHFKKNGHEAMYQYYKTHTIK